MKTLVFNQLNNDKLIKIASQLSASGYLAVTLENLVYLNIDDNYIHQLFPLLEDEAIKKPGYFGENLIGAHISVIYPEENKLIHQEDLKIKHNFSIKGLYTAELEAKTYYALTIDAPSLLQLRKKYGLPKLLFFRNYQVEFHITIAIRSNINYE